MDHEWSHLTTIILEELKPLSVNSAYINNNRGGKFGRVKSKKYLSFEYDVIEQLDSQNLDIDLGDKMLKFDYRFYFPIYKKGTTILSKTAGDVFNFIKPLEDIMQKRFKFDDAFVICGSAAKIESAVCRIEVDIAQSS